MENQDMAEAILGINKGLENALIAWVLLQDKG